MGELDLIPRNTFYRIAANGLVECVDAITGVVVGIQKDRYVVPATEFREMQLDGRTVMVQHTVDFDSSKYKRGQEFNKIIGDIIVQKIIEGVPISEIPKHDGMPSLYTMARWRRESKEFDTDIRFARQMRAERLRDEALAEAALASGEVSEYVAGRKLKVESLKWAAEKDSPGEYGNKVEVSGKIGHVHMVIETGIRRQGDKGLVVEKVVESVNPGENVSE
jgi:hypothetical protein